MGNYVSSLNGKINTNATATGVTGFTLTKAGNTVVLSGHTASIASVIGFTIPSGLRPTNNIRCPVAMRDTSYHTGKLGIIDISTAGAISFLQVATYGADYTSVSTGLADFIVTWNV